jgi:hypothetical protein
MSEKSEFQVLIADHVSNISIKNQHVKIWHKSCEQEIIRLTITP